MKRPLGAWSRRIVRALAEVVVPDAEGGAPRVPLASVVEFVERHVPHMPRGLRLLFPVGLLLLELGALVLAPSLVPFSAMSRARRVGYIQSWIRSRMGLRREMMKGMKGLCLLAYYSDPAVMRYLGYDPEPHVATVSAERLRRHGS